MSERWVINASPIILLAKIEHFHLNDAVIRRALQETVGEQWPD